MRRYAQEIEAALESAAGSELELDIGQRATVATQHRVAKLRRQLTRLLEDLPDDLTIAELREEIE